jgi:PAS domain S-box-containing protein
MDAANMAKQALDMSDFRWSVAEASPMPMAAVDGSGHVVRYVNPAFCRLAGKSEKELIGNSFSGIVPAGDECLPLLDRVYQTGQSETYIGQEHSVPHPYYWSYAMWPVLAADGTSVGIVVQVSESARLHQETVAMNQELIIGSLHQHELAEALREREETLRIALAASDTGTFRWNPHTGEFLAFGENLKRLSGFAPDERVQVTDDFIALVHPDDRDNLVSAIDRCQQGADFEMEFRIIRPDGALRWLYGRGKMERDIHGNPAYLVGACTDITKRKKAEQALLESIERFHFVAESMRQKIFTATPNGDIDYLNQQWMEYTGLSFDQIKNWGWTQFIHPDDVDENVCVWQHSIETGEPIEFVHRFRRADGAYRWHLSRGHGMPGANGKISMWIGSSTDIHKEKEIEEELRRANEALNQFAFAASHDLQEPLRMITGYSQLLVKRYQGQLDENASVYMGHITEGTTRMGTLLADLLSYTKVAADQEEPAESIDFSAVYKKATQNLQTAIAESGAVVSCDHLPVVKGREAHFLQLLQNLISNAIKYRGEHSPRIHISAGKRNREWCFAVADNGMGIAPEFQQQIFGVFKRLHGNNIPGTGIGLAICHRVVEHYGGRIWVESELNRGATFYFTLPIDSGRPAAAADDAGLQRSGTE